MNLLLAITVGVAACWLLAHVIITIGVIVRADSSRISELKHLQGSASGIFKGRLKNQPSSCDYRVVQGLEWDSRKKTFIEQSRLSTEALRATFFN